MINNGLQTSNKLLSFVLLAIPHSEDKNGYGHHVIIGHGDLQFLIVKIKTPKKCYIRISFLMLD
jgi:hypothetical protein